ncbi:MAG: DNA polymerase III subunit gamma/tau, partial [Acidimicrobiales bacterium]
MAFQSLYRRYRPQRFGEVLGQDHVTRTLRNAVRTGSPGHAYLFSGPRGTGKTSTARILAKALNCLAPEDGEPCGRCASCVDIAEGRSLDVVELDAASNRGIDAMRDLVARVALGTAGRWKVYIVDEVHMLTTEAGNTLLKTLEEPPAHVVFILATTEPQKVLPTIRSRTQAFEFRLFPATLLVELLTSVAADAGLDVAPEAIALVARRGNGSARDALSVLDQVAAAGGIDTEPPGTDELIDSLVERDAGQALLFVAERSAAGHDPRQLARDVLEHLRHAFLATMSRGVVGLPDDELARVEAQGRRLGPAATVRAMEVLGETLVAMRDAPDPRVLLEVALVRLCRPETDVSPAALLERLERLEQAVTALSSGAPAVRRGVDDLPGRQVDAEPGPPPAAGSPPAAAPPAARRPGPAAGARQALGRPASAEPPRSPGATTPRPPPAPAPNPPPP